MTGRGKGGKGLSLQHAFRSKYKGKQYPTRSAFIEECITLLNKTSGTKMLFLDDTLLNLEGTKWKFDPQKNEFNIEHKEAEPVDQKLAALVNAGILDKQYAFHRVNPSPDDDEDEDETESELSAQIRKKRAELNALIARKTGKTPARKTGKTPARKVVVHPPTRASPQKIAKVQRGLWKKTVKVLKQDLAELGERVSGNKQALVTRYLDTRFPGHNQPVEKPRSPRGQKRGLPDSPNAWQCALHAYTMRYTSGWCMPKSGTKTYDRVKKLQKRLQSGFQPFDEAFMATPQGRAIAQKLAERHYSGLRDWEGRNDGLDESDPAALDFA